MMPGPDLGKLVENLTAYARAGVDSPRQGWGSLVHAGGAVTLALLVVMSAVAMPVFGQAQIGGEVQITGDPATDGSTYSYPLSDPDVASDPVFNLTGVSNTESENYTTSISDGSVENITISGNAPANAVVNLTGDIRQKQLDSQSGPDTGWQDVGDTKTVSEVVFTAPSDGYYNIEVDGMIEVNGDGSYGWLRGRTEGGSWNELKYVETTYGIERWEGVVWANDTYLQSGQNYSLQADVEVSGGETDSSGRSTASATTYEGVETGQLSLDVFGKSMSANLSDGETYSENLNDISPGERTIENLGSNAPVEVNISVNEKSIPEDPGVELNNENASYSGTLAEGETTQLTLPSSALVEGTNTINVSMPELSADAPTMQVGLEYSHTAASNVSVSSISGQWQSQYTLNKTFPDARSNATARLAFPDEVVSFKSVDVSRDGGSYETLPTSQWTTDETDLVAELGDVATNETVSVKATAQKVRTENGEIVVLEPTPPGSALSSKVEVASRSEGFHIATNTTQLLTASSPSYDGEDAYSIVDQTGQEFYLPNAQNQSTFTAEHVGLEADPVTGDVLVDLESTSAPLRFRVEAGETGGDQVDYRYLDASSGLEYTLYSLTYDEPRASAASGGEPVVLRDDDTGETLQISSATSSGGTLESSDSILEIVFDVLRSGGIVAIAGGSIVALFFAGSRVGTEDGTLDEDQTGLGLSLIGLLVALPITLEVLSPGAISSRIGAAVSGVIETALGPVLVIGVGGLIFLVYTFLQTKEKKAPTLIFRGGKKP